MNYELSTGSTSAVLIDPAEIGAALGSGDMELGHSIISTESTQRYVAEALVELLDGGALADLSAEHYVQAFNLLCRELGYPLPACRAAVTTDVGDCFDIPTELSSVKIAIMDTRDADEFLRITEHEDHSEIQHVRQWCERAVANDMSIAVFATEHAKVELLELVGTVLTSNTMSTRP